MEIEVIRAETGAGMEIAEHMMSPHHISVMGRHVIFAMLQPVCLPNLCCSSC